MKFPGSKLLHHWDLSTQSVALADLLRSCQQTALTGFAEVRFPQSIAMIFYYLGGEVNALYREGPMAYNGQAALERLRAQVSSGQGSVSVYELPLDLAHLLRGIINRHRLQETLRGTGELLGVLAGLEKTEHTGTLEIQTAAGSAILLIVHGRVSNAYWESPDGRTLEGQEARTKLDEVLDAPSEGTLFLSEFSRETWKSRHEVQDSVVSRLERPDPLAGLEPLVTDAASLRQQILDELCADLPALIQAFMFDMMTGAILARRTRPSGVQGGLLAEKVPAFVLYLRDLVAAEDADGVEVVEVTTERVIVLVGVAAEALEAIAVVAERAQPGALIAGAVSRAIRRYATRLHALGSPVERAN